MNKVPELQVILMYKINLQLTSFKLLEIKDTYCRVVNTSAAISKQAVVIRYTVGLVIFEELCVRVVSPNMLEGMPMNNIIGCPTRFIQSAIL